MAIFNLHRPACSVHSWTWSTILGGHTSTAHVGAKANIPFYILRLIPKVIVVSARTDASRCLRVYYERRACLYAKGTTSSLWTVLNAVLAGPRSAFVLA